MLNTLKNLFKKSSSVTIDGYQPVSNEEVNSSAEIKSPPKNPSSKSKKPRKPRAPKSKQTTLSEKEKATLENEPYVNILKMNVDSENINAGSFELDWNDKFVLNLIRAGYKIREDDTDSDIVDRWFTQVCRNVALEFHEQQMADPTKRASQELRQVTRKDIGNGRSEIS
jgi:hypothetical protein